MEIDPRVDAYIENAAPFARPILLHLRDLVHRALPGAEEAIKWNVPHFTVNGKNVAGLSAFKAHCALGIHGESRRSPGDERYLRIASLDALPEDSEITAKLQAAYARISETGSATLLKTSGKRTGQPDPEFPIDFASALGGSAAAAATFDALAPSHRREYLEWIVEARRAETRARRIVQAVEWLAQGKKRNWKYGKG